MDKITSFSGLPADRNFLNWNLSSFVGSIAWIVIGKMMIEGTTSTLPDTKLSRFVRKKFTYISAGTVAAGLFAFEATRTYAGLQAWDTKDVVLQTAGPVLAGLLLPRSSEVENLLAPKTAEKSEDQK